jgi:CubicO group peptidase (beta-lactamase class C family)
MTDLRQAAIEAVRRHSLGGLGLAVVRGQDPVACECLGLADRASQRPITIDTVFRVASISKTMTATGIMQLHEDGLLGLDDPVNNHLKAFQVQPAPGGPDVTFRHLLTHTAGIGKMPRVRDLPRRRSWGAARPGAGPANLAELYGPVLRTEVAAGTKWAYANHGFAVLGQLVEDVSGVSFADYMRERVFDRLGMSHTDYLRTPRVGSELASGYHWIGRRLRPVKDYDLALLGPGSVLSSLADMAIYTGWLRTGGPGRRGQVLRPETLAAMMSPQYSPDARLPGLGLAFFLDSFDGHRVAGHAGNNPGFASSLLVAPDDGIGVVALTNNSSMFGAYLAAASVLRGALGVGDPAKALPRRDIPEQPHLWADLVGYYAPPPGFLTNLRPWQMFGGEVEVAVRQRHLVLRALSPLPALRHGLRLYPMAETDPLVFGVVFDGVLLPVCFRRDDADQATAVVLGAPALTTLYRRPTWRSSGVRLRTMTVAAASAAGYRALRSGHGRRT